MRRIPFGSGPSRKKHCLMGYRSYPLPFWDMVCLKISGNLREPVNLGSAYLKKKNFLRVIPTLNHYSDIVSDIPSGSIYGIFILTFFFGIYFIIL